MIEQKIEEKVLSKASHFYDNAVQRITAKGKMPGLKTKTARNTAAGSIASQRVREAERDSDVQQSGVDVGYLPEALPVFRKQGHDHYDEDRQDAQ